MTSGALATKILEGRAGLAAIEAAWWELFSRTASARPFQSPAWLLPWSACCTRAANIRAIAVLRGSTLAGLLPLQIGGDSDRALVTLLGRGITDYLDALVDPAETPAVLERFARALPELIPPNARLELPDLPHDSALLRLDFARRDQRCTRTTSAVCPHLVLDRSFPEILAKLPRWLARNLRQGETRLRERGVRFRLADEGTLARDLEAFFELHGARWGVRGESGVLHDPAVREFHRRAAPRLFERGLLELVIAELEGRAIAAAYVLTRRDAALYLTGFDPSFARCSLGSVIIARSIERAIAGGRSRYDFLRGGEPYKYHFGANDSLTASLSFEPSGATAARRAQPRTESRP
jgi:CelD/BcsL family acetyltransferase involved in cellulose biosynthesis